MAGTTNAIATVQADVNTDEIMDVPPQFERRFLPQRIEVSYRPTPDGWCVWSIWIAGHAVLKNGETGKSTRGAFYGLRNDIQSAPAWARDFAATYIPKVST